MKISKKTKRIFAVYCALVLVILFTSPAYAADDPLTVVNNLSNFIFGLIRAIGLILLGFGIVQIGLSLKSHDPSQRANGFLTLAGGVIITFAREILNLITGGCLQCLTNSPSKKKCTSIHWTANCGKLLSSNGWETTIILLNITVSNAMQSTIHSSINFM